MSGPMTLLVAGAGLSAGAVAGLVFFGGLAATVRRLPDSSRPALLMLTSLLGRLLVLAAVLVGLALVDPVALVAGGVGMLGARFVVIRRSGPAGSSVGT